MNVVWSDEALYALVALEIKLAERYSDEKAAQIVDELVQRVHRLQEHPQLGRKGHEVLQREALQRGRSWIERGRPGLYMRHVFKTSYQRLQELLLLS